MAAALFFLPFSTATVNGIAQPGAQLFFYQTGTLTKLPIYTTDLLNQQLTNPVPASGAGRFPDIYLDGTQTYRLVVKDKNGGTLDDIDPYIPGTIEGLIVGNASATANTRAELAMMAGGTGVNAMAFLSEPGREGMFTWSTADFAARFGAPLTTVDPQQGVYVAPAADTTGASGAWVRAELDALKLEWFGAKGDWVGVPGSLTGAGTDDLGAFNALLAFVAYENRNGYSGTYPYARGGRRVLLTAPAYYKSDTVDLKSTLQWIGAGAGQAGGFATRIVTAASKCHFRVQRFDTVGTGGATTQTTGAGGTIFDGICFEGLGGTPALLSAGVWMRDRAQAVNCRFMACAGPGLLVYADTGGVGSAYGNANGWKAENVRIEGCKYGGLHVQGGDANAGAAVSVDISDCARYGLNDRSFLGSGYNFIETASCGVNGAAGLNQTSTVTDGSYRYRLKDGQDASAAGTAPTAGTSNAVWEFMGAGGVHPFFPLYATYTGAYVSGGGYYIRGTNCRSVLTHCYNEGDQAPPIVVAPSIAIGGIMEPTDSTVPFVYGGDDGIISTVGWQKKWADPVTGKVIQTGVGGTVANALTLAYHTDYAPNYWRTSFGVNAYRNPDLWTSYQNSFIPECLTGPTTVEDFGTGTPQPYYRFIINFAFGDIGQARRWNYAASVPTTGLHARGEIVWNNAPSSGGNTGWICTVSGTPGTWVVFGIAGGAQAATSSATYVAASGGTTIDTQARASQVQLAADLADMRAKLQTGKLMT